MKTITDHVPNMTKAQEEAWVASMYENFPEASTGSSLQCVYWKYAKDPKTEIFNRERFKFVFEDAEDGKKHTVRMDEAVNGLRILVREILAGKLKFYGLGPDFLTEDGAGNWDGVVIDALAQCAVFGEVIYG